MQAKASQAIELAMNGAGMEAVDLAGRTPKDTGLTAAPCSEARWRAGWEFANVSAVRGAASSLFEQSSLAVRTVLRRIARSA
ncbi:MAG: hypothetical protein AAGG44_13550 [Planctomycetota bacterium]